MGARTLAADLGLGIPTQAGKWTSLPLSELYLISPRVPAHTDTHLSLQTCSPLCPRYQHPADCPARSWYPRSFSSLGTSVVNQLLEIGRSCSFSLTIPWPLLSTPPAQLCVPARAAREIFLKHKPSSLKPLAMLGRRLHTHGMFSKCLSVPSFCSEMHTVAFEALYGLPWLLPCVTAQHLPPHTQGSSCHEHLVLWW